jgi:hypothetical protein
MEEAANPYVTPALSFKFHYFALRKMHFMMRAKALVAFPGGFGTLDELFEVITLVQTRKAKQVPIVLFGSDYWKRLINFDVLIEEGVISPADLGLFHYADDPRRRGTSSGASTRCEAGVLRKRYAMPVPAGDRGAHHPEHARDADHRAGGAEQHRHADAGRIDGHQPQGRPPAVAVLGRDLVQGAHDHRLHRAQRQAQQHRAQAHRQRRVHQRIEREQQGRHHHRAGDHRPLGQP